VESDSLDTGFGCPIRAKGVRRGQKRLSTRVSPTYQAIELWVTDVTEYPTREGKVYCAVVFDAWSRRVIESYLRYYNFERAHTGRRNVGRPPAELVYGARNMRPR
jgi:hypothetical protein